MAGLRRSGGPTIRGQRWAAAAFAAGSAAFLVGPVPGYLALVGPLAVSVTLFAGSLLFTAGAVAQFRSARAPGAGRVAWWVAAVQLAGTLCFNLTTARAIWVTLPDPDYNRLVWRPDLLGSACFLISAVIAFRARPPRPPGRWQPGVNLLGSVLFGVAAVAGFVDPPTGTMLAEQASNRATSAGAACFLACALAGLQGTTARLRRS